MTRLAMAVLLGQSSHLALAVQSQIPMRVGDCVKATTELEFFYKDEGEYERTHRVRTDQHGVLLNIDSDWNEPSNVEFLNPTTREPHVSGAVFFHQFARVPWEQGNLKSSSDANTSPVCLTVKDGEDKSFQKVVTMSSCAGPDGDDILAWKQQFSYTPHECGPRPIRFTDDPSKCVDAVHPNKVLLTDCSGVDSQKFQFRCEGEGVLQKCYILAMGGRKDMCLWWDHALTVESNGHADLQVRSCNYRGNGQTQHFAQERVLLGKRDA